MSEEVKRAEIEAVSAENQEPVTQEKPPEKPDKRKTAQQRYIDEAARAGAREVLNLQRRQRTTNLYRAMERLLKAYPKFKAMHDNPDEYGFLPVGKSKDISVAPPPGSGARDPIEALAEHVDSRASSYDRTMGRFMELEAVIRLFQDKPEFIVIRMYYFNEDANGNSRGDAKGYTFPEIAEALESVGIQRSEKALRIWRTKLVQDMTVMMFGVDGAVSVEAREPKQGQGQKDGEANARA